MNWTTPENPSIHIEAFGQSKMSKAMVRPSSAASAGPHHHRELDFEGETTKLLSSNQKLKAEVAEEEDRLKRLQTQVLKAERDMAALRKTGAPSSSVSSGAIKASMVAQVQRLGTIVAEKVRGNELLRRQLQLLKHAPPSPSPRRPVLQHFHTLPRGSSGAHHCPRPCRVSLHCTQTAGVAAQHASLYRAQARLPLPKPCHSGSRAVLNGAVHPGFSP